MTSAQQPDVMHQRRWGEPCYLQRIPDAKSTGTTLLRSLSTCRDPQCAVQCNYDGLMTT